MRLHVIGCSPAWPNPGGAHSGYVLEEDGRRLLLDCGPGVLSRLREHEPWPRIDAIAISHFHLDHWGDLIPWALGALNGDGRDIPAPQLWLPPGGRDTLRSLDPVLYANAIGELFEIQEYAERTPFRAASFEIVPYRTLHYATECYALRVMGQHETVAYSADSGPCDSLVELARDVDLFLCEATLERPEPEPRGHLTLDEALQVFTAAEAHRLLVIHRPRELPLPDQVEIAEDGLELEI